MTKQTKKAFTKTKKRNAQSVSKPRTARGDTRQSSSKADDGIRHGLKEWERISPAGPVAINGEERA